MGNATAGFGLNWTGDITTSGAFYRSKVANCMLGGGGGARANVCTEITLNASTLNSIYGSSDIVTPLSQSTLYILKY